MISKLKNRCITRLLLLILGFSFISLGSNSLLLANPGKKVKSYTNNQNNNGDHHYFLVNGKPKFVVGINYQSAEFGHDPAFWESENVDEILERDFQHLKKLGVDVIRIQSAKFHRPKTFAKILEYARKYNIGIIPNLTLGDLTRGSLESWFMAQGSGVIKLPGPSHQGRFMDERSDPFVDPLLSKEEEYIKSLLSRYKNEKMIFAWDICNEPNWSLYGGSNLKYAQYNGKNSGLARKVTGEWAKRLCQTARKADPNHPITIGIDHGVILMDVGFDVTKVANAVDFMSTHGYSRNTTGYMMIDGACSLRDTYMIPFVTRLSQMTGKSVANGECGNNSYVMSEQKQGNYYRVMLYSQLVNEAVGIFPWCFHDYDFSIPRIRKNYNGAPSESAFGIVRPDNSEKPAAVEFGKFSRFVKKIDFSEFHPAKTNCAILYPSSYYEYLDEHRGSLFNAFVLAKQAHLQVDFVHADSSLSGYKLLILPTTHLTISQMDKIKRFVRNGGSVWCSVTDALGGKATYMADILGWRVDDYIVAPAEMELKFVDSFGSIKKETKFNYTCNFWTDYAADPKPENKRQYLTIAHVTTAQVMAKDSAGRPTLLLNKVGKGNVISTTFGLEYFLSQMPDVFAHDRTYELYKELASRAGIDAIVTCDRPEVELSWFEGKGQFLVFIINHEYKPLDVKLKFNTSVSSLRDFLSNQTLKADQKNSISLKLSKNGVKVLWLKN